MTNRIARRSDVLFNDMEVVREHERFFAEATKGLLKRPQSLAPKT